MSRAVASWVAKHDDQAVPKAVRLRVWIREGGRCSLTGRKILAGDAFDYEHRVPLSMGGEHSEANLCLALRDAHRRKTADEATVRAKADRVRLKHLGQFPKSPTPLKSRNTFRRRAPQSYGNE